MRLRASRKPKGAASTEHHAVPCNIEEQQLAGKEADQHGIAWNGYDRRQTLASSLSVCVCVDIIAQCLYH